MSEFKDTVTACARCKGRDCYPFNTGPIDRPGPDGALHCAYCASVLFSGDESKSIAARVAAGPGNYRVDWGTEAAEKYDTLARTSDIKSNIAAQVLTVSGDYFGTAQNETPGQWLRDLSRSAVAAALEEDIRGVESFIRWSAVPPLSERYAAFRAMAKRVVAEEAPGVEWVTDYVRRGEGYDSFLVQLRAGGKTFWDMSYSVERDALGPVEYELRDVVRDYLVSLGRERMKAEGGNQ